MYVRVLWRKYVFKYRRQFLKINTANYQVHYQLRVFVKIDVRLPRLKYTELHYILYNGVYLILIVLNNIMFSFNIPVTCVMTNHLCRATPHQKQSYFNIVKRLIEFRSDTLTRFYNTVLLQISITPLAHSTNE